MVAASSGGFGCGRLGWLHIFPPCLAVFLPVAASARRENDKSPKVAVRCRGVSWGGWGGVGWPRASSRRAFEVGNRFFPPGSCPPHSLSLGRPQRSQVVRKARCRIISRQFLLSMSCCARSLLLLALRGQSLRFINSSWPRVLTSAPFLRPSLAQGRRGTRSPQKATRFKPRVVGTSSNKSLALPAPFRKATPNNQTQNFRPARRSFITVLSSQKAPSLLIQRGSQPRERARHFPEPSKEK